MPRERKSRPPTWPPKFKTGLTPISRLGKYTVPLKMVGDPEYAIWGSRSSIWSNRASVVYSEMMVLKRGGWSDNTWIKAHDDNIRLDRLIERKWDDHDIAWEDHKWLVYDQAQLDNWNWEYAIEWPGITA